MIVKTLSLGFIIPLIVMWTSTVDPNFLFEIYLIVSLATIVSITSAPWSSSSSTFAFVYWDRSMNLECIFHKRIIISVYYRFVWLKRSQYIVHQYLTQIFKYLASSITTSNFMAGVFKTFSTSLWATISLPYNFKWFTMVMT